MTGDERAEPSACLAASGADVGARMGAGSSSNDPNHPSHWVLVNERVIGNGSFGVVYQAQVKQNKKERPGTGLGPAPVTRAPGQLRVSECALDGSS